MSKSSISKQLGYGAGSEFAIALGAEIRRRRKSGGFTQRQLGHPLTGAYVSAIETGRCLPSVGALLLMARHLGVDPGELLSSVKGDCPDVYTPATWREPRPSGDAPSLTVARSRRPSGSA